MIFSGPKNDAKSEIAYATVRSKAALFRQRIGIACNAVRFKVAVSLWGKPINSFEGGGVALPEYTSRKGCGVRVPDW